MASIEQTTTGYAVRWRLGGTHTGAPQTARFPVPPGARREQLAESRAHRITAAKVKEAILGANPAKPTGIPTFAQWVDTYLDLRHAGAKAQPDTIARYARRPAEGHGPGR